MSPFTCPLLLPSSPPLLPSPPFSSTSPHSSSPLLSSSCPFHRLQTLSDLMHTHTSSPTVCNKKLGRSLRTRLLTEQHTHVHAHTRAYHTHTHASHWLALTDQTLDLEDKELNAGSHQRYADQLLNVSNSNEPQSIHSFQVLQVFGEATYDSLVQQVAALFG